MGRYLGNIHIFKVTLLLGVLFLCAPKGLKSQHEVKFAKTRISLNSGQLYFNVLQCFNDSSDTLCLIPKLIFPPGWRSMTFLPKRIILAPNSKKYIPVRVRPSKTMVADKSYKVVAEVTDSGSGKVFKPISDISVNVNHDWSLDIEEKMKYFPSQENSLRVQYRLENKGNAPENIVMSYLVSEEILLTDDDSDPHNIVLNPGQDTTISVGVRCVRIFQSLGFTGATLTLMAEAGKKSISREISFVKLKSTFDHFEASHKKPDNVAGVTIRSSASQDEPQYGAFVKGRVDTGEKGFLSYEASSSDLFGSDDFWFNNQFAFNYQSQNLKAGLGSSMSNLGEGLFKKNSLFGDVAIKLGDRNRLLGFANTSLSERNTGVALGHQFSDKGLSTLNSIAYNSNSSEQLSTLSARSNTQIYFKRSFLDYQGEFVDTQQAKDDIHTRMYTHLLKYEAEIGDRGEFLASSDLETENSNLESKFSNRLQLRGVYSIGDMGVTLSGMYVRRDYNEKKAESSSMRGHSNDMRVQLSFPTSASTRFNVGSEFNNAYKDYGSNLKGRSNLYDLFMDASYQKQNTTFRGYVKYGMRRISQQGEKTQDLQHLEMEGRLTHKVGFSGKYLLGMKYSSTPTNPFNIEEPSQKLVASASYKQSVLRDRLNLSVDGSYDLGGVGGEKNYNLNFSLDAQVKKNLGLSLRANWGPQGSKRKMGMSSVEGTMYVGFDNGKGSSSYYDLEVQFFKDANANGTFDKDEESIESVRVEMKKSDQEDGVSGTRRFLGTALLSDSRGRVECHHLPLGGYVLTFLPLKNLNGFFNFDGNSRKLFLDQDKSIKVPYVMASKIFGTLSLARSNFSSLGEVDLGNIRVTAIDSLGREYSSLTDRMGNYTIYVPKNRTYKVFIKSVFGSRLVLNRNNVAVSLMEIEKFMVNFELKEKKRRINFKRR